MIHDGAYISGTYICYAFAAVCIIFAVKIFVVKPKELQDTKDLKKEQIHDIRRGQIASGMILLIIGALIGFSADYIIRFIANI